MFGRKKKKNIEETSIEKENKIDVKKNEEEVSIENENKVEVKKEIETDEPKQELSNEQNVKIKPDENDVKKPDNNEKIVIRRKRKKLDGTVKSEKVDNVPKKYKEIVIRETKENIQASILEDGRLVEHIVSIDENKSIVENIYYGKVQSFNLGMTQAFVDIGTGKNAVIYASDIKDTPGLDKSIKSPKMSDIIKIGESILVQVKKDKTKHKGASLTTRIVLSGKYVDYLPETEKQSGAFKKLNGQKKEHIREIFKTVIPNGSSAIAREACDYADDDEIINDIANLISEWDEIKNSLKKAKSPVLIKGELNIGVKVMRDIFSNEYKKVIVSGDNEYKLVKEYIRKIIPKAIEKLEKWDNSTDIFAVKKIDEQISKALDQKINLPSGGSLVFDRTEAMTVVDVNTGRYRGDDDKGLEEIVTANNLEAAEELIRQIRLKDIGGIITVDFIDMVEGQNQNKVLDKLITCLKDDRTNYQVSEFSKVGGLVIMTRKKIGIGLLEAFSKRCENCDGRGYTLTTKPVKEIDTAGADFQNNYIKKQVKNKDKKVTKKVNKIETNENAEIMRKIHENSKGE